MEEIDPPELSVLENAVENGTRLEVLRALATLAAHELDGNKCSKCQSSLMKMGEISSLMLRLQKIYEEIEGLEQVGKRNSGEIDGKPKRGLRDIQRTNLRVVGGTASPDSSLSVPGSKSAPRRQGGRQPRK